MQGVISAPERRDFTKRRHFPGTVGTGLNRIEDAAVRIERLPAIVFAVGLFVLAWAATRGELYRAGGMWMFYLGDWALLAGLPRLDRSFGPAKPTTVLLALLRLPAILFPLPYWFLAELLGTGLVFYGFWVEPHQVTVTRQSLVSSKLAPGHPLRVLHLSDLHVERVTDRERQLLTLVRELAPDLILISGDFLNVSYTYDQVAWQDTRAILGQLYAPLGVYAVTGSPTADRPEVVAKILDGMHIRLLQDEKVTIEHNGQLLDLVGVSCTHKPFVDEPKLEAALDGHTDRFTLLLYHTPDLAPEAAELGVDLQLSGHTHGGQVRLPVFGALYTGSLYGKLFESGRRQLGQLTLYVSRGIGLEGLSAPRVRFLCPPEITLWELSGPDEHKAQKDGAHTPTAHDTEPQI